MCYLFIVFPYYAPKFKGQCQFLYNVIYFHVPGEIIILDTSPLNCNSKLSLIYNHDTIFSDLTRNRLSGIEGQMFHTGSSLSYLDLRYNLITILPMDTFVGLSVGETM